MKTPSKKATLIYEAQHEISINVVCATSKGSDQPVNTLKSRLHSLHL